MTDPKVRARYTPTIGIECHVQLKTKSKLFSAVGNDAREAPPNTLVSHIDFGLPGALPFLNGEAVRLACKAAFALGTEPERFSKFDRKHYFYPDLPKGYQISQYDQPIIGKGAITIEVDGAEKTIGITRAHMEEDAGKSTHPAGKDYSLVDLNRAGTPLLEIVSEPDMHTAAEAKAYARELYLRMRYADVSDADLYYGNMRFDVNVSVSKTDELGTRSETKNLNSFRSVERAVEYEIDRQIELLENGERVVQETRGWDDAKQATFSQRSKENAEDYRYMPDPDLPPIVLDEKFIADLKKEMPTMPDEWRRRLKENLKLDASQIDILIENQEWVKTVWEQYEKAGEKAAKDTANLLTGAIQNAVSSGTLTAEQTTSERAHSNYTTVSGMLTDNLLSSSRAKDALIISLKEERDVKTVAEENNWLQVSDEDAIAKIVTQVLSENAKAAEDVKNGEMKAIGFLVGQVMKQSQGKANPQMAQELIKKQLGL